MFVLRGNKLIFLFVISLLENRFIFSLVFYGFSFSQELLFTWEIKLQKYIEENGEKKW